MNEQEDNLVELEVVCDLWSLLGVGSSIKLKTFALCSLCH